LHGIGQVNLSLGRACCRSGIANVANLVSTLQSSQQLPGEIERLAAFGGCVEEAFRRAQGLRGLEQILAEVRAENGGFAKK
jgi:hypothetical protein